jgi:hypothetical protein
MMLFSLPALLALHAGFSGGGATTGDSAGAQGLTTVEVAALAICGFFIQAQLTGIY